MENSDLHTGTVVFYSASKGYGFLKFCDSDEEIFFHCSGIIDGFVPSAGEAVTFTLGARQGRPIALQVTTKN